MLSTKTHQPTAHSRALPESTQNAIRAQYQAGILYTAIAANLHVSPATISRYTKDLPRRRPGPKPLSGTQPGSGALTEHTRDAIRTQYRAGIPRTAIAENLSVSLSTITRYAKDLPRRPPGARPPSPWRVAHIRTLRTREGLTATETAHLTGLSLSTVYRYAPVRRTPPN